MGRIFSEVRPKTLLQVMPRVYATYEEGGGGYFILGMFYKESYSVDLGRVVVSFSMPSRCPTTQRWYAYAKGMPVHLNKRVYFRMGGA